MTVASLIRLARDRQSVDMNVRNNECLGNSLASLETLCTKIAPFTLEPFACSLNGVYISCDFISVSLAEKIFEHLKQLSANSRGEFVQLRGRRCISLGGTVTESGLVPSDNIPVWLDMLMKQIDYPINHALINIYKAGEGILPHEDGPAYSPFAVVLSLGSACVFDFLNKKTRSIEAQISLPIGSLLVFKDEAYTKVLHQYDARTSDPLVFPIPEIPRLGRSTITNSSLLRGERISITLRHVPIKNLF